MFQVLARALRACVRVLYELRAEKGGANVLMRELSSNGLGGHATWRAQKGLGGGRLDISDWGGR